MRKHFRANGICGGYNPRDKEDNSRDYVEYMLARSQSIFAYRNLPDTVPRIMLELMLQTNGNVAWARVNGDVYVFTGGLGGPPDAYYRPTQYVVANPGLNYNATLDIGKDCIVMLNDSMLMGLLPMYRRYAVQLSENDLTMYIADINTRIVSLLTSDDDRAKASAEEYLRRVESGELGVIGSSAFLEGVKTQPYASAGLSNSITQLIELQQYLKAGWYNDLGLQSNYNMKREAINSNEAQLNEQSLLPLIDDMLRCRREALEKVNEMFGLNIQVELYSAWDIQHNDLTNFEDPETEDEPSDPETEDEPSDPETEDEPSDP